MGLAEAIALLWATTIDFPHASFGRRDLIVDGSMFYPMSERHKLDDSQTARQRLNVFPDERQA